MSKKKILIIDDHKDFRSMLASFIQMRFQDTEIKEAESGEQGVEMAKTLKPDVSLVDISLPGIDGIEAARMIKAQWPGCQVITMSLFKQASLQELINKKVIVFVNKGNIDSELLPFLDKFLGNNQIKMGGDNDDKDRDYSW